MAQGNLVGQESLVLNAGDYDWFGTPPSLATFDPLGYYSDGLGAGLASYFDIDSFTPPSSIPELLLQGTITEMNIVPEPSSIALAAIGAALAALACRRKRK